MKTCNECGDELELPEGFQEGEPHEGVVHAYLCEECFKKQTGMVFVGSQDRLISFITGFCTGLVLMWLL